jgi:hypothetical protein
MTKYAVMVNLNYATGDDTDWQCVLENSKPVLYDNFDIAYQAATTWMQQNEGQSKVVEYLSE